jgi:hypothetical protein
MSAIGSCRTAALGGHVERCEARAGQTGSWLCNFSKHGSTSVPDGAFSNSDWYSTAKRPSCRQLYHVATSLTAVAPSAALPVAQEACGGGLHYPFPMLPTIHCTAQRGRRRFSQTAKRYLAERQSFPPRLLPSLGTRFGEQPTKFEALDLTNRPSVLGFANVLIEQCSVECLLWVTGRRFRSQGARQHYPQLRKKLDATCTAAKCQKRSSAYTPEGQTRRRSVQSTTTTGYARSRPISKLHG